MSHSQHDAIIKQEPRSQTLARASAAMRPDGGGDDGGGGDRDARLFTGVRFALYGFDPALESQIRGEIIRRGGEEVHGHEAASVSQVRTRIIPRGGEEEARGHEATPGCTHLIVDMSILFDNLKCAEARKQGAKVVTKLWVDFSLTMHKIEDPDRILYMPARGLKPIPGFHGLNICCAGYGASDTKYIMTLIEVAGAKSGDYTELCDADLLICKAFQGCDYDLSVKMRIDAVTHYWLRDCILQWKFIPIDNYTKLETPTKAPISSHLRMLNTDSKDSMLRPRMSPAMLERGAHSTGSKRNRSSVNNGDHEFVSDAQKNRKIDHPKCKKSLYLDGSRNCDLEAKTVSSSKATAEDRLNKCLGSSELTTSSVTGARKVTEVRTVSSSKATAEDGSSACLGSLELATSGMTGTAKKATEVRTACSSKASAEDGSSALTVSGVQAVTLKNYANKRLTKFREVPEAYKIVRTTKEDIKVVFMESFTKLANFHKNNSTLSGQFGPENFVVSPADNSVEMVNLLPLVPYSEDLGNKDYDTFVKTVKGMYEGRGEQLPPDVSEWLALISKGVHFCSPVLIANHILMMPDEAAYGIFTSVYRSMIEYEEKKSHQFKRMLKSKEMSGRHGFSILFW